MAVVWRLVDPRFATALDGEGNRLYGARWNSPGRGAVYASENLSLCVLETWVHLNPEMRRLRPSRSAVRIALPDDATTLHVGRSEIPEAPAQRSDWCRQFGDRWLEEGKHLALIAPSVVVPYENNVVLNPRHPQMADVRIESVEPFRFDERLS